MDLTGVLKAKICIIGEAAVGKTSLIRRYVEDAFDDRYISTLGSKVSLKRIWLTPKKEPSKQLEVQLSIWDLIGERSRSAVSPTSRPMTTRTLMCMSPTPPRMTSPSFRLQPSPAPPKRSWRRPETGSSTSSGCPLPPTAALPSHRAGSQRRSPFYVVIARSLAGVHDLVSYLREFSDFA